MQFRHGDVEAVLRSERALPPHPYAEVASRLVESGGLDRLTAPAFLLTLFVPDRAGILARILDTLSTEVVKQPDLGRLGIDDVNIEASVTASLSEVAVVGLVVRPVFGAHSAWHSSKLDPARLDAIADVIAREVTGSLRDEHPGDHRDPGDQGDQGDGPAAAEALAAEAAVTARVRSLGYANESTIYAGKHFREVRFGIRRGEPGASRTCGFLLRHFASILKARGNPIAYVHYPHRWNSYGDGSLDWLRIAYAADPDAGSDSAIEILTWNLASEQNVALVAYEPSLPHPHIADRFARLHEIEPADTDPPPRDTPPARRVGLCAEGEARVGLVADLLGEAGEAGELEIQGCTMAVLRGRTVANLILSGSSADELEPVLRDRLESVGGEVQRFEVSTEAQVVPRKGDQDSFTFWLAWICPDRTGTISTVLRVLNEQFALAGRPTPNIVYGVSRVLVDGRSCVAKFKFSCRLDDADALGLLDGQGGRDTNSVSTSRGAAHLTELVVLAFGSTPDDWPAFDLGWDGRLVQVAGSEPHEEPWGSLGLPVSAIV